MIDRLCPAMLIWAARDLGRHPGRHLATLVCVFGLALLLGTIQLTHQAVVATSARLLAEAPAIVVRRAAPTGWQPLPIAAAMAAVRAVPGALGPQARIWGLAQVSAQTVMVVALPPAPASTVPPAGVAPRPGEVVIGHGAARLVADEGLVFDAHPLSPYRVVRELPANLSLALHDTVLMHPEDARAVLGLAPGMASDLAIDVFHEAAVDALREELAKAFPWPVQISTRRAAAGRAGAQWGRRATLATLAYLPAMLALTILALAGAVGRERGKAEAGLLRALGWTGRDFLRLSLWRWACLGVPGVGLGLAAAYLLVFTGGARWLSPLLFGWTAGPPALHLSAAGSALVLVQAAALVALPHLAIVVASGLRHGIADPERLMEEASS